MTDNYYIVEFSDGLQLIPKNWMMRDNNAFWPNYTNVIKYDNAVKTMESVKDDWKLHDIKKIYGKAKTFEMGKEKLKEAEKYSDLSTDVEGQLAKDKRKQRARKRLYSSTSGSESNDDNEEYPSFPLSASNARTNSVYEDSPANVLDTSIDSQTLKKRQCTNVLSSGNNTSTPRLHSQDNTNIQRILSGLQVTMNVVVENQKKIIEKLNNLEASGIIRTDNDEFIVEIYENIANNFPIKSQMELNAMEENLKNDLFKARVVKEFSKIGGKDIKNIVYNLMPKILTNEVAAKFSWFGAKGKKLFSVLYLAQTVQDIVRHHLNNATNKEIETPIKKWLSKARERMDREKKKETNNNNPVLEGNLEEPVLV